MTAYLLDNVGVRITTTGMGSPLSLGDPVELKPSRLLSFMDGDAVDGTTYAYKIIDGDGWEIASGIWSSATNTITRTTYKSYDGQAVSTSPLDLSGRAFLIVVLRSADYASIAAVQAALDAATAASLAASASASAAAISAAAADPSSRVQRAGDTMTGALNLKRATVASNATTSDIWSAGNEIDFTGTATVTNFPAAPAAGASRRLFCAGACVFTNNANIAVQGAATYTASAGDIVTIDALTTTTFRATIERASGVPLPRGTAGYVWTGAGAADAGFAAIPIQGWTLLSTLSGSGVASIADTTSLTSAYDLYAIVLENVLPATNSVTLRMRVDVGSGYATTGYTNTGGTPTDCIALATTVLNAGASGIGVSGVVYFNHPQTNYAVASGQISHSFVTAFAVAGFYGSTSPVTAAQFSMSSGNIASGKIRIYGIKTS